MLRCAEEAGGQLLGQVEWSLDLEVDKIKISYRTDRAFSLPARLIGASGGPVRAQDELAPKFRTSGWRTRLLDDLNLAARSWRGGAHTALGIPGPLVG